MGKVLEKIVHKHLFNYIRDDEILSALQSGFIPGDSAVSQLVDIYNTFCKSLDEGNEVLAVFCNISKAFDRVWHRGLIFKLESIGVSDSLLLWFKSYLADRKQRVVLPGAVSAWKYIKAGVPQGSILGPLLFLIYINDIVADIHSSIRLFADDKSLYIIVDNPQQAAILLNADLAKIHLWASRWLVSFNPSKSESMTFFYANKTNLLEYSNVVWDNCTQYESNDLEKIQNEAARIVTGATKLTSLQSLYIETGWESLASRRQKSKLVLFYKM